MEKIFYISLGASLCITGIWGIIREFIPEKYRLFKKGRKEKCQAHKPAQSAARFCKHYREHFSRRKLCGRHNERNGQRCRKLLYGADAQLSEKP